MDEQKAKGSQEAIHGLIQHLHARADRVHALGLHHALALHDIASAIDGKREGLSLDPGGAWTNLASAISPIALGLPHTDIDAGVVGPNGKPRRGVPDDEGARKGGGYGSVDISGVPGAIGYQDPVTHECLAGECLHHPKRPPMREGGFGSEMGGAVSDLAGGLGGAVGHVASGVGGALDSLLGLRERGNAIYHDAKIHAGHLHALANALSDKVDGTKKSANYVSNRNQSGTQSMPRRAPSDETLTRENPPISYDDITDADLCDALAKLSSLR